MSAYHLETMEALTRAAVSAGQSRLDFAAETDHDDDRLTEGEAWERALDEFALNPCAVTFAWETACRLDCDALGPSSLRDQLRDDVDSLTLAQALAAVHVAGPADAYSLIVRIRHLTDQLGRACTDVRGRVDQLMAEDAHA